MSHLSHNAMNQKKVLEGTKEKKTERPEAELEPTDAVNEKQTRKLVILTYLDKYIVAVSNNMPIFI